MKRGRAALGVALVAGLLGLAFVGGMGWSERRAQRVESLGADAAASRRSDFAEIAGTRSPPAASDSTPGMIESPLLPPIGRPVAAYFDDLASRARNGDARAACRLATDLQRCARTLAQREFAANLQDQAARRASTPPGLVEAIAELERRDEMAGERCDGLQPAQLAQAFAFQLQAAQAIPELRVWFALNPALERRDFVNELERWAEYRRRAMPWLEAAAREGDVEALIALSRVHGDLRRNSPPYPPFRLDDPVRSLAYHDVLHRLGIDARGLQIGADEARARLDAAGLARAAELADTIHRPDLPPPKQAVIDTAMQSTLDPFPMGFECGPAEAAEAAVR